MNKSQNLLVKIHDDLMARLSRLELQTRDAEIDADARHDLLVDQGMQLSWCERMLQWYEEHTNLRPPANL